MAQLADVQRRIAANEQLPERIRGILHAAHEQVRVVVGIAAGGVAPLPARAALLLPRARALGQAGGHVLCAGQVAMGVGALMPCNASNNRCSRLRRASCIGVCTGPGRGG